MLFVQVLVFCERVNLVYRQETGVGLKQVQVHYDINNMEHLQ